MENFVFLFICIQNKYIIISYYFLLFTKSSVEPVCIILCLIIWRDNCNFGSSSTIPVLAVSRTRVQPFPFLLSVVEVTSVISAEVHVRSYRLCVLEKLSEILKKCFSSPLLPAFRLLFQTNFHTVFISFRTAFTSIWGRFHQFPVRFYQFADSFY